MSTQTPRQQGPVSNALRSIMSESHRRVRGETRAGAPPARLALPAATLPSQSPNRSPTHTCTPTMPVTLPFGGVRLPAPAHAQGRSAVHPLLTPVLHSVPCAWCATPHNLSLCSSACRRSGAWRLARSLDLYSIVPSLDVLPASPRHLPGGWPTEAVDGSSSAASRALRTSPHPTTTASPRPRRECRRARSCLRART